HLSLELIPPASVSGPSHHLWRQLGGSRQEPWLSLRPSLRSVIVATCFGFCMVPAPPRVVSPHRSEALPERSVSWLTLGCAGGRFRFNRAPDRESGDGAERDAFGHRGPFVTVSPLEGDGFEPSVLR